MVEDKACRYERKQFPDGGWQPSMIFTASHILTESLHGTLGDPLVLMWLSVTQQSWPPPPLSPFLCTWHILLHSLSLSPGSSVPAHLVSSKG